MKVLFVDDEEMIRDLLKMTFENQYDVYVADDGLEALEIKEREQIFVIYTDLVMPNMSGVELCKKIREKDPVSIIGAFTGHKGILELYEMREVGFDDYLPKPFNIKDVQASVNESVRRVNTWLKVK